MNYCDPLIKRRRIQRLDINSIYKYRLIFKNNSTKPISAVVNLGDRRSSYGSNIAIPLELKNKLHKLLCRIKPLKKLDLVPFVVNPAKKIHSMNQIHQQIKKSSRNIQELCLKYQRSEEVSTKINILWLKHAKKLKKAYFPDPRDNFFSKMFFRYLKGTSLETLILHRNCFNYGIANNYPRGYPKTVKKLCAPLLLNVFFQTKNGSLEVGSPLKNLEYFSIGFYSLSRGWNTHLLDVVCSLHKLRAIEIEFTKSLKSISKYEYSQLANLKNLERIYLAFAGTLEGADKFLDTISNSFQLKTFSLVIKEKVDIKPKSILSCLSSWKDLERLELNIYESETYLENSFFEKLLELIGELTRLEILKFKFDSKYEFTLPFQVLINKLTLLKEFEIKLHLVEPNAVFFDLLRLCRNNHNLERINIDVGSHCLEGDYCQNLCETILSLKKIQVLEFPLLSIKSSQVLHDFTESVLKRKYLRRIKIGTLLPTITKDTLIENLVKLVSFRGLKKFRFGLERPILQKFNQTDFLILNQTLDKIKMKNKEVILCDLYHALVGRPISQVDLHWLDKKD